ncbi:biofilm development regulator YmgB/AriR family protein [Pantoea dispersa]|uniref:biofilm development regulator YmgB/AriR family protein n=1 Tax=Pantoea dispersa TaxID=59814 RepID=UPI002221C341|nr:biofilm development regulator YmgB/AriR family protein [Pantoea dispersa]UYV56467.1 biofilm development regulator YmgB/AriR family protein [Pantoea dispersa]
MRNNGLPPCHNTGLAGYFSQVTDPRQIALLGRITVEILRQERRLTRTAICLKLIGHINDTHDDVEAEQARSLLAMLFGR